MDGHLEGEILGAYSSSILVSSSNLCRRAKQTLMCAAIPEVDKEEFVFRGCPELSLASLTFHRLSSRCVLSCELAFRFRCIGG